MNLRSSRWVLHAGLVLWAGGLSVPLHAQAAPSGLLTAETEAAKIVDLFYDLQFARAMTQVQELETRYPASPAGPFYLSVAYYEESLLQEPPNPKTVELFQSANDEALRKALALLPTSPALSHYYQGAVLGFQARSYIAQKRYALAIPKARQGVMHLKKALQLDPTLEDANLGLGLYYYFLSRLPPAAKPFAYMTVGMWGDRDKGLSLLKEVMEKGHPAQREAQSVLGSIYASQHEQRWDEALALLKDLMARYPHNPRYRIKLVYVLQRQGLWEKAAETADPEGSWLTEIDPLVKDRAQSVVRYRAAESLLFAGRISEVKAILGRLESGGPSGKLKDWIALREGNYWDAMGQPVKAKPYYESVQDKKARGLSETFIKTPFPSGPRDVMPSRWPLPNIPSE